MPNGKDHDDRLAAEASATGSAATERLTAALAGGDERAVDAFYRLYFDWLYAQARRASHRDEAFCLDVVQDAVLRIIRTVRAVPSETRFRAWLRLVVQTVTWDKLRAERRRHQHELAAVAAAVAGRADNSPEEPGGDEQQMQWLRQQIARLDPAIVRMIELRFEQRWTLARISNALGLSIGTIDGRLRRALAEIRDRAALEEFGDE